MNLSLVIPCYNEAANLPNLLERCRNISNIPGCEVVIVDNGSTDDSPNILNNLLPHYPAFRMIRIDKNIGYGFGILTGLRSSKGQILAWTHADLQTDPNDVIQGLSFFEKKGSNIYVKGRRYGRPFIDTLFTIGMGIFESILLRKVLWDINAQPNIFSRDFFQSWENPPHDFSLDLYVYFLARHQGLQIFRFPVEFKKRIHGISSWNVNWQAKIKFIRRTINFSFELKKGFPK